VGPLDRRLEVIEGLLDLDLGELIVNGWRWRPTAS
jgi:hypothetical protein